MNKKQLDIKKTTFNKKQFNKTINKEFTELVDIPIEEPTPPSIEEFFQLYNELFLDIPKLGATNSHEFLIKNSRDYVGDNIIDEEIIALQEEINSLRQDNLELNRTLLEITNARDN
jgi:hypothetical protein